MQIFFAYCAHLQAYLLNSLQNYYIRLTLEVSECEKMQKKHFGHICYRTAQYPHY